MSVVTAHMVYFCAFAGSEIFQKNARKSGVGRGQVDAGVNGLRKEELNEQLLLGDDVHNQLNQIQAATSDVDQKILQIQEERPSSFNIVLGNIDLKVLASDMTSDNQNKDYHWCNHNALLDRGSPLHLENDVPTANLQAPPNSRFLPSLGLCLSVRTCETHH